MGVAAQEYFGTFTENNYHEGVYSHSTFLQYVVTIYIMLR